MEKETNGRITKYELDKLLTLTEREAKALKTATNARKAQVIADGEAQIATKYSWDYKPTWREKFSEARKIVAELNCLIAKDMADEGVPKEFMPGAEITWSSRGENNYSDRRKELQGVLKSEAEAQQYTAQTQIELWSINTQKELLKHGLESDLAQKLLAERPSLESLMPALKLGDLENKLNSIDSRDRWRLRN